MASICQITYMSMVHNYHRFIFHFSIFITYVIAQLIFHLQGRTQLEGEQPRALPL